MTIREIGRFLRIHWAHLLVLPVMALGVTIVHESAHAVAILAQGGTIVTFTWIPSGGHWGSVGYTFPPGHPRSEFAIAIAPYALWLAVALATAGISACRRSVPFWLGSSLFVWGFVVPLADVANDAVPFLLGARTDLARAFGSPRLVHFLGTALLAGASVFAGFPIHRRLYGTQALSAIGYGILVGALFVLAGAAVLALSA